MEFAVLEVNRILIRIMKHNKNKILIFKYIQIFINEYIIKLILNYIFYKKIILFKKLESHKIFNTSFNGNIY